MYPVQSMRKFVCDRLTLAAQEILGAFEKKVQDYEAEIARQRRMLDTVFTPETKLQQTELSQTSLGKEGEARPNQQQHSSHEPHLTDTDAASIKDEHEEMCISEERERCTQQREAGASKVSPTCSQSVCGAQPRQDQAGGAAKEDASQSHMSDKDLLPETEREISAASAANSEQQLLSQDLSGPESQGHIISSHGSETPTGNVESTPNKISSDENTSAASTEQTLDKESVDENTASFTNAEPENTASSASAEPAPDEESPVENTSSSICPELTMFEEWNNEIITDMLEELALNTPLSPELIPNAEESGENAAPSETTEPTRNEQRSNMPSGAGCTSLTPNEESHHEDSGLKGNNEPTPNDQIQDERLTSSGSFQLIAHEEANDKDPTSARSTEPTANEMDNRETEVAADTEPIPNTACHYDTSSQSAESRPCERLTTTLHGSTDQTTIRKPNEETMSGFVNNKYDEGKSTCTETMAARCNDIRPNENYANESIMLKGNGDSTPHQNGGPTSTESFEKGSDITSTECTKPTPKEDSVDCTEKTTRPILIEGRSASSVKPKETLSPVSTELIPNSITTTTTTTWITTAAQYTDLTPIEYFSNDSPPLQESIELLPHEKSYDDKSTSAGYTELPPDVNCNEEAATSSRSIEHFDEKTPVRITDQKAKRRSREGKEKSSAKATQRRRRTDRKTSSVGNTEPPQIKNGNSDATDEEATSSVKRKNDGSETELNESTYSTRKRRQSRGAKEKQSEKRHKRSTSSRRKDENTSGASGDDDKNPYKCDRCGKVMSNFKNYKFHMKSHTVEKTFKCETCGKMFRESWDLNKHLVIHSAEKPFKCEVCGNGFTRRYNLDLHLRVHTGEKPYICSTCGKSFTACVNMRKHMRIHTGEKPYTCSDCGKEFADSSSFKNHRRVHTGEKPFKCNYCKKKFATRTTLKRHIRTHTGEKPYKCSVCDKMFGHRTDLKGHMRLHTGEKPYKCNTCEEQFSTWIKLNKHKRVHSTDAQSSTV
ncbi:B-cell lymphoma 6 protein homolog [Mugil cephalus]|uniref:B-cell lymphoma 6 protein homolog n=1 Tax=Mugil cephalus TaxID=48193 RepID=UPI001FB72439|nr:B-cell lymphoma 6 protein homolog [Mugil cephalus]